MKTMQLKKTTTISLIIFSSMIAVPGVHLFAKDKDKGIAKAIILRGNVKAKLKSGKVVTIKRDKWVPEGAVIRTGKQSFVKFLFVDKSQMNLGPKSQMEIAEFPEDEAGVINLVKGKLRSKVTKNYMKIKDKDKSKLFIKTETAAMGVRGTDFRVDYNNQTQQTNLTTFEGKVAMAKINSNVANIKRGAQQALEKAVNSSKAVMVKKGEASSVAPGKDPSAPKSVPEEDLQNMDNEASTSSGDEGGGPASASSSTSAPAKGEESGQEVSNTADADKEMTSETAANDREPSGENNSNGEPEHVPPGLDIETVDGATSAPDESSTRSPASLDSSSLESGSYTASNDEESMGEWEEEVKQEHYDETIDETQEKPDYLDSSTQVQFLFDVN